MKEENRWIYFTAGNKKVKGVCYCCGDDDTTSDSEEEEEEKINKQ